MDFVRVRREPQAHVRTRTKDIPSGARQYFCCRLPSGIAVAIPLSPQIWAADFAPNEFDMFDFEKLEVYQMAKTLVVDSLKTIYSNSALDPYVKEQWRRASMGILLSLSDATARMTAAEKRHCLTLARSAVFECVAILEVASQLGHVPLAEAQAYYERYEAVSKMLLAMYRSHGN